MYFKEGKRVRQGRKRMSEEKNSNFVIVTLKMPDGKEYEILLPPKTFSSGREGFYGQIPVVTYNDKIYGGQIQVWDKTKIEKKE